MEYHFREYLGCRELGSVIVHLSVFLGCQPSSFMTVVRVYPWFRLLMDLGFGFTDLNFLVSFLGFPGLLTINNNKKRVMTMRKSGRAGRTVQGLEV